MQSDRPLALAYVLLPWQLLSLTVLSHAWLNSDSESLVCTVELLLLLRRPVLHHCHVTAPYFVAPGYIRMCKYLESTILKATTCSSSCSACSGTETENFSFRENVLWCLISDWWGFPLAQHVIVGWCAWLVTCVSEYMAFSICNTIMWCWCLWHNPHHSSMDLTHRVRACCVYSHATKPENRLLV